MSVQSIERTWSEDHLAEAVRDHFRLQVIGVGHVAPRGAVHVTDHAVMGHVGSPSLLNRATALSMDEPDVALGEVDGFFAGLPHSLWVDADTVTGDVDGTLRSRGYLPLPPQHGMVCTDLEDRTLRGGPLPPVELLTEPADAAYVADVAASGYGLGAHDRRLLEDLARAVLHHARPWDHGALYGTRAGGGRIVSVGVLLCTRTVAGITGVVTLPGHRDRHRATAVVARAVADAAALGAEVAVTLATPDSESALARLGFRTVVDYRVYRQARP